MDEEENAWRGYMRAMQQNMCIIIGILALRGIILAVMMLGSGTPEPCNEAEL